MDLQQKARRRAATEAAYFGAPSDDEKRAAHERAAVAAAMVVKPVRCCVVCGEPLSGRVVGEYKRGRVLNLVHEECEWRAP